MEDGFGVGVTVTVTVEAGGFVVTGTVVAGVVAVVVTGAGLLSESRRLYIANAPTTITTTANTKNHTRCFLSLLIPNLSLSWDRWNATYCKQRKNMSQLRLSCMKN